MLGRDAERRCVAIDRECIRRVRLELERARSRVGGGIHDREGTLKLVIVVSGHLCDYEDRMSTADR